MMMTPEQTSDLQIRPEETFGVSAIDHNMMKMNDATSQNSQGTSRQNIVIFDENVETAYDKNSSPVLMKGES